MLHRGTVPLKANTFHHLFFIRIKLIFSTLDLAEITLYYTNLLLVLLEYSFSTVVPKVCFVLFFFHIV